MTESQIQPTIDKAPELMAELGEPWPTLWHQLVTAHDAAQAAKIVAGLLGAVVAHGQAAMDASLSAVLDHPPARFPSVLHEAPRKLTDIPAGLAGYTVQAACAADYDPILHGGRP